MSFSLINIEDRERSERSCTKQSQTSCSRLQLKTAIFGSIQQRADKRWEEQGEDRKRYDSIHVSLFTKMPRYRSDAIVCAWQRGRADDSRSRTNLTQPEPKVCVCVHVCKWKPLILDVYSVYITYMYHYMSHILQNLPQQCPKKYFFLVFSGVLNAVLEFDVSW